MKWYSKAANHGEEAGKKDYEKAKQLAGK